MKIKKKSVLKFQKSKNKRRFRYTHCAYDGIILPGKVAINCLKKLDFSLKGIILKVIRNGRIAQLVRAPR